MSLKRNLRVVRHVLVPQDDLHALEATSFIDRIYAVVKCAHIPAMLPIFVHQVQVTDPLAILRHVDDHTRDTKLVEPDTFF